MDPSDGHQNGSHPPPKEGSASPRPGKGEPLPPPSPSSAAPLQDGLRASVERLATALSLADVTPEEARRLLEGGRISARDGASIPGLESARWQTIRQGSLLRWHLVDEAGRVRAWLERRQGESWQSGIPTDEPEPRA